MSVKNTATSALEGQAAHYVKAGTAAGVSLAPVLVELYNRAAWLEHSQSIASYFTTVIGIGEEGFILPKAARQQVVVAMSNAHFDAPLVHLAHMTGCAMRTINRDRSAWELANPARVNSQAQNTNDPQPEVKANPEPAPERREPFTYDDWHKETARLSALADEALDLAEHLAVVLNATDALDRINEMRRRKEESS